MIWCASSDSHPLLLAPPLTPSSDDRLAGHMPTAQRVQTEAALAHRYGISYSSAPSPVASPARDRLSRFSCAPRSPARTSESH